MSDLNPPKDNSTQLKRAGNLIIFHDPDAMSKWEMPDCDLEKALFRIHVTKKLVEFFKLEARGIEKVVSELLNSYERGVESAINNVGKQFEHPEYAKGYQDYMDLTT